MKQTRRVFITISIFLMYTACLSAGFALMRLWSWHIDIPSAFWRYLLSAFIGTTFFFIAAAIISHLWKGHQHYRMAILDETVEVLGRLS